MATMKKTGRLFKADNKNEAYYSLYGTLCGAADGRLLPYRS
jgi:hypothetical protein